VTCALVRGVNVTVQVMLPFTASEAAGEAGVHVVTASAGAPITAQVAFTAGLGLALVQTMSTETGVPTVAATVVPEPCISAWANGLLTLAVQG
jgi:hypothetical protein